jgi:hypothetical protein
MLVFRRFLKWRRYKSFLLYVLILAWITEIVFAVRIVAIADVSLREIGMFASVVVVQVIVFLRLSFLRWYYTNWRDPTMQLCIAIADIDRQLMVAQHPMLADMASGVQPTRKGLAKEKDSSLPVVRHGAVEMTGT